LKDTLKQLLRNHGGIKAGHRNVFIAVEAVYSMDGDVAPLKEIVRVMHELLPLGNGHLIVDEAHSNGVLGPQGRGLVCQLALEKEVSVRLHTFGKALACNGGMTICQSTAKQESSELTLIH
jgi:8-amino-7-oxononanoate synthase